MRVVFLDIDGVLNSDRYDRVRDMTALSNIDETRLPLLKEIVGATGALIVLTSSWRGHWDENPAKRDESGQYIDGLFEKYGLKIYGKTGAAAGGRAEEIKVWLSGRPVSAFAIIDDYPFGWGDLTPFLVKTNPHSGFGLEKEHVQTAVALLLEEGDDFRL